MKRAIKFISNVNLILGLFGLLFASGAYALDYYHKDYIIRTELQRLFIDRDLITHETEIIKLQTQKTLRTDKSRDNEFNMLIAIEQGQIVRLGGKIK